MHARCPRLLPASLWWASALLGGLTACGDPGSGLDGGAPDGGGLDGGAQDAGIADTGTTDGGTPDGGVADAGLSDAGPMDGGLADAGAPDAPGDAGGPDGGPPGCVTSADGDGVTRVLWYHAAYDNLEGPDVGGVNEASFLDMIADLEASNGWEIDVWYLGTADNSGPTAAHGSFHPLSVPLENYDALFIESDETALYSWPYSVLAMTPAEEPWTPIHDAASEILAVRGSRTVLTGLDVDFHAGEWRSPPGTGAVDLVSHRDGARVTDGGAGLLTNMIQWAVDGEGLGLVVGTMGGSWFDGQLLGLASNPSSFLHPEVDGHWTDAFSGYSDVEILDPTHPIHAGLTSADLSGWPGHGVVQFGIPGYVGLAQTAAGSAAPVGYVTAVKELCER